MAEQTLEFTPTWIVAGMCSFIVLPSLLAERCLHYLAKAIKRRHPKPLYKVFLKIKQELLQGFVALLLTVFQKLIQKTCISPSLADHMLPCQRASEAGHAKQHYVASQINGRFGSRMLSEDDEGIKRCRLKGEVPLLSSEVIHQLEIFIFVLAVTHVPFSVSTMFLGAVQMRKWKHWENAVQGQLRENGPSRTSRVQQSLSISNHFKGIGQDSRVLSWLHSFVKQFYVSVTKIDYTTMRLGFIMNHCRQYPHFNFHDYMMRTLQNDFKKVVGISWYMWIFVMVYLLLNINGWHTYFWIAFLPLLITYGFNSCIMGQAGFTVPRLVIGVIIQFVCGYSTLPLYAIVTQMGSRYQKEVFSKDVQHGLQEWAKTAKMRVRYRLNPGGQISE